MSQTEKKREKVYRQFVRLMDGTQVSEVEACPGISIVIIIGSDFLKAEGTLEAFQNMEQTINVIVMDPKDDPIFCLA